ncbi:MAG: ribbon-helix-helix protein, CopG family [Leptolyngbya sp. SIO4C5]|nr:ribbon-helix-helix protein, CopG family [Leptolyngbya sp. SIO4C5]
MSATTMKRLSASIPDRLYERLEKMAEHEGRSVSNLVSYLLEHSLDRKLEGYIAAGEEKPKI